MLVFIYRACYVYILYETSSIKRTSCLDRWIDDKLVVENFWSREKAVRNERKLEH